MARYDNTNLHQSLRADPVQNIAKSNSSTSINAKAIKVIKPDLVPPSDERNKNSEKENEDELAVLEGQNMMEEDAKRRKLDHKFYSIQDCNHLKSDIKTYNAQKEDDQDIGSISDPDILDMIKTITESREKYPLPNSFTNCPLVAWGNTMLMFDEIGPITDEDDLEMFIPWGLRAVVEYYKVHSKGSKHYGFVGFSSLGIASCFINKFNDVKIPGTDLSYKLSWAPIKCGHNAVEQDKQVGLLKALEMKTLGCDGEEHVDESKDNQYDGPGENPEIDKQVDVPKALEIYDAKVDKIATGLEQLFSRLDDEAHSGTDVSPFWRPVKVPTFDSNGEDDGVTRTLFLCHVDPVIKEDHIMRVFGKYGECSVDHRPGGGLGTVTFEGRSSAESAYVALSTVLKNNGICTVIWGFEEEVEDEGVQSPDRPLPCYISGWSCPKALVLRTSLDE